MTTVITLDIATEIENAEIDMLSSRLERLQTISGNPMQVQMKNSVVPLPFHQNNCWSCF